MALLGKLLANCGLVYFTVQENSMTNSLGAEQSPKPSLGAVCKWSKRFDGYGIAGLTGTPGRGRKARFPAEKISLIVERATRPPHGRARWSVRSMAREAASGRRVLARLAGLTTHA
jgi:hypothetical protein